MMFVLSNISIFLFVSMCVFAYHNRERTGFKIIIYSSGIYSISIILFYFDVKYLLLGRPSAILTFITCLFVFTGITLFVRSLTQLYQIKSVFKISVCILFIIVTSALMTVLTIYDEYFWRTVVFYIGIILPLIVALYYQKKSSLTPMFNLISSQIYLIFFVIGLNTIYFLLYDQELDFTNPPEFSKIFLMIVNILIITLIFSFIVEKNGQDIKELHEKGELLENMFFKVKLDSDIRLAFKEY